MLPCHGNRDLFRHPPMTAVYNIRPHCPEDKVRMPALQTKWYIFCSNSVVMLHCFVFCTSWRFKGFSGRYRAQERAKSSWWCSLRLLVTGKKESDFSLWSIRTFIPESYSNIPSVPLQPVIRWDLPVPSVCSRPGGWHRGVWLRPGTHRRQTSRSQDSGDRTQHLVVFQNTRWRCITCVFSHTSRGQQVIQCWRTSPPWLPYKCCPGSLIPLQPSAWLVGCCPPSGAAVGQGLVLMELAGNQFTNSGLTGCIFSTRRSCSVIVTTAHPLCKEGNSQQHQFIPAAVDMFPGKWINYSCNFNTSASWEFNLFLFLEIQSR